jgi:hypothetical protein
MDVCKRSAWSRACRGPQKHAIIRHLMVTTVMLRRGSEKGLRHPWRQDTAEDIDVTVPGVVVPNILPFNRTEMIRIREGVQLGLFEIDFLRRVDEVQIVLCQIDLLQRSDEVRLVLFQIDVLRRVDEVQPVLFQVSSQWWVDDVKLRFRCGLKEILDAFVDPAIQVLEREHVSDSCRNRLVAVVIGCEERIVEWKS